MIKKIIILFILTVLLATLLFVTRKNSTLSVPNPHFFSDFSASDVISLDIDYFVAGITLKKAEANWTVADRKTQLQIQLEAQGKSPPQINNDISPANQDFVDQALNALLNLTQETLISTNVEKQGLFELTDAALSVTLTTKAGLSKKLFVGKEGPSPYTTYVREANSQAVYLVSESLAGLLNRPLDEWKKKEEVSK